MIKIYTTAEQESFILNTIQTEERLNELVSVWNLNTIEPELSANSIVINDQGIFFPVDWKNTTFPYLIPTPIKFEAPILLGLIFWRLANYEKTFSYLQDNKPLLTHIDIQIRASQQVAIHVDEPSHSDYWHLHNAAILAHYGNLLNEVYFDTICRWYNLALLAAPNNEWKSFTSKHYATLLADFGDVRNAERIVLEGIQYATSSDAKVELKSLLSSIYLSSFNLAYDTDKLMQLKELLTQCLLHYEKYERTLQVALTLIDAAQVATVTESFSEALGYINRSIDLLIKEEQVELIAKAKMQKGILLSIWAQQGSPQFYKSAMECLLDAIKVFTREEAPHLFAEIHHQLGIIYSEIPDETKKKSVWAAVSYSSFKEALHYFTHDQFPYEYATICNHFGNAHIKYPNFRSSDNIAKALDLFNQALAIRTVEKYPIERALTLLNYVEASWYANNGTEDFNVSRFEDMKSKIEEVLSFCKDEKILKEAKAHQQKLETLRVSFMS